MKDWLWIVLYICWLIFMPVVYQILTRRHYWDDIEGDSAVQFFCWILPIVAMIPVLVLMSQFIARHMPTFQEKLALAILSKWEKSTGEDRKELLRESKERTR